MAALSLAPQHLKRYRDVAALLLKYGRGRFIADTEVDELLADEGLRGEQPPASGAAKAEELAADLERLGPTFVKVGQVLSSRADLLPVPYLEALSRLQDDVAPFGFDEVEAIVHEELGVRLSKAFSTFDPTPLAAASLGQVHRAALRDGRPVAVKVQRPRIRQQIVEDLEAMAEVAQLFDRHTKLGRRYHFGEAIEEFRKTLFRELDYRIEAQNLGTLADNLAGFPRLVVPRPVADYTTSRVLTMDYVAGTKITSVSPLARLEIDHAGLADELFRAYLKQILVDGFFHADPHPGNVFLTDDRRVALIDLGMVAHVSPGMQERLLNLVLAASEGRGEDAARLVQEIGERLEHFDERLLTRTVSEVVVRHRQATLQQIAVGRLILDVSRRAAEAGMRLPSELTLLGKTLMQLDEIGRTLDPDFDPNQAIRRHAADLTSQRLRQSLSPGNLLANINELKQFFEQLPSRANRILDRVAQNDLSLRVDAIDEKLLVDGIHNVANRITMGLVLAALIVGAALLMQVKTSFTILGYPGLAILCFLAAAAGGSMLVVNILVSDFKAKRQARASRDRG
jgi:predicted unusual protein kinase regulating ubiquinone biosynthesis (AarF/ABC1/UbiB family)